MSLFEENSKEIHHFPTLPAFVCRVEVRDTPQHGNGHKGVFALERIPKGTKFWVWTDRVQVIPQEKLDEFIDKEFGTDHGAIQQFLRQGFVLPPSPKGGKEDQFFYSNPTDAGRFMNHSNDPNCGPDGALTDIQPGDEMTMDYFFHGNPQWYQVLCRDFGVLTERQVAEQAKAE